MEITTPQKQQLSSEGYLVLNNLFTEQEVAAMIQTIDSVTVSGPAFRLTSDLFAIRRFVKEVPAIIPHIFTNTLQTCINQLFGNGYFLTKSIYFDKPEQSNWFVAYHQDLTISVNEKLPADGFSQWTVKHDQFAVQPPVSLLENIFTIRIHLDDTDENNGALKIIPQSHRKGIWRVDALDHTKETEVVCKVKKGGIMIMQPLLLHASNRTTNKSRRRVIHLEFSNQSLPGGLQWAEYLDY